jgi:hypothetical protein
MPAIFGGRRGHGPLLVACDTNIIIDLAEHAESIWEGTEAVAPGAYGEEVAALGALMHFWIGRDIRLVVDESQIADAKKAMTPQRAALRERQVSEIVAALTCTEDRPDVVVEPPVLEAIGDAGDRAVARAALARGCHVLLTNDADLLPPRSDLAMYGLAQVTPIDLLTELLIAGEPAMAPCAHGALPDMHKVAHLRGASVG